MTTFILYVQKGGTWRKFGKVRRETREEAEAFAAQAVARQWPVKAEPECSAPPDDTRSHFVRELMDAAKEHEAFQPDGPRAYNR